MKRYKVINPILHCDLKKYQRIADVSRQTWMSNACDDIFSFFYQGGAKQTHMKNDVLRLKCQDSWSDENANEVSTQKMILAFDYCLNNFDFDFIFRTSNSTYVSYDPLIDYLTNCSDTNFYGGGIAKGNNKFTNHKTVRWVFGHAILISKDLVELVVKNRDELIKYNMIDDAALGHFASNFNIKMKLIPIDSFITRCKPERHEQGSVDDWVLHVSNRFRSLQSNRIDV